MSPSQNERSKVTKSLLVGGQAGQFSLDLQAPPPPVQQLWTADQIYERVDEGIIVAFSEDRRVERKGARVQAREIGECLSMWANTGPDGGLIFIGVENDGSISGCRSMDSKHQNTIETMQVHCADSRALSKVVNVKNKNGDDDFVIVFRVPFSQRKLVNTSSNKAFFRQGSTKFEMPEELKREHRISRGEIHHEAEDVALNFPTDFDENLVRKFCKAYASKRNLQSIRSDAQILAHARLGRMDGKIFKPNLAGCLILAKDPRPIIPGCYIRVTRYQGVRPKTGERLNSIFDNIVEGPLPTLIDAAAEMIGAQLRGFQRLTGSGRLERKPEYPRAAWLEAIVNAVGHRSYNLKVLPVAVRLFDDRMVVESPGTFVPPVTADTIYEVTHTPRNSFLMEALWYLEIALMQKEGTQRMRDEMRAAGLPDPIFSQSEPPNYLVTVVLENDMMVRNEAHAAFGGLEEHIYLKLPEEERLIVNYLSSNPGVTVSKAASLIQKSEPTASKYLNSLVQKDLLNPFVDGRPANARPKTYSLKKPT